jgi:hypothetical protein
MDTLPNDVEPWVANAYANRNTTERDMTLEQFEELAVGCCRDERFARASAKNKVAIADMRESAGGLPTLEDVPRTGDEFVLPELEDVPTSLAPAGTRAAAACCCGCEMHPGGELAPAGTKASHCCGAEFGDDTKKKKKKHHHIKMPRIHFGSGKDKKKPSSSSSSSSESEGEGVSPPSPPRSCCCGADFDLPELEDYVEPGRERFLNAFRDFAAAGLNAMALQQPCLVFAPTECEGVDWATRVGYLEEGALLEPTALIAKIKQKKCGFKTKGGTVYYARVDEEKIVLSRTTKFEHKSACDVFKMPGFPNVLVITPREKLEGF